MILLLKKCVLSLSKEDAILGLVNVEPSSSLANFIENIIEIYDYNLIYYKNICFIRFNDTYLLW